MDDGLATLSPNLPATARATFQSLPAELVHHIIRLALPPLRFTTFEERYTVLVSCSLVSKEWKAARRELWRHICVESWERLNRLRDSMESEEEVQELRRNPGWTESLRGTDGVLSSEVIELLAAFPRCAELWVSPRISQPPHLIVADLSSLPSHLTHLHLDEAHFTNVSWPPSSPSLFGNLVALSISDPRNILDALEYLQASYLPHLRSLSLLHWTEFAPDHVEPFNFALSPLAPQLCSFAINSIKNEIGTFLDSPWHLFTSLRHLSLTSPNDVIADLHLIPSTLRTLRLCPRIDFDVVDAVDSIWTEARDILRERPACLEQLVAIELPVRSVKKHFRMRMEVEKLCRARGIRCELREVEDELYASRWEDQVV